MTKANLVFLAYQEQMASLVNAVTTDFQELMVMFCTINFQINYVYVNTFYFCISIIDITCIFLWSLADTCEICK